MLSCNLGVWRLLILYNTSDFDKLVKDQGWNNSKSKIDNLDVDKLKTVPVDLKKLNKVVNKDLNKSYKILNKILKYLKNQNITQKNKV